MMLLRNVLRVVFGILVLSLILVPDFSHAGITVATFDQGTGSLSVQQITPEAEGYRVLITK